MLADIKPVKDKKQYAIISVTSFLFVAGMTTVLTIIILRYRANKMTKKRFNCEIEEKPGLEYEPTGQLKTEEEKQNNCYRYDITNPCFESEPNCLLEIDGEMQYDKATTMQNPCFEHYEAQHLESESNGVLDGNESITINLCYSEGYVPKMVKKFEKMAGNIKIDI